MIMRLKTLSKLLLLLKGGDAPHLNYNFSNMKQVVDNITIWTEDTYSKDALYNIKYLWKDEEKENTDIQFMPRVVDSYRINTVDSPYKCVLKFSC
jgi:hypothetical protein